MLCIKWVFTALIGITSMGCGFNKGTGYAYKTKSYKINTERTIYSVTNLLSYKEYLFEFITEVNITDTISIESGKSNGRTEYISKEAFYLLKNNSDSFFLFDRFSPHGKLLKRGRISEKAFGLSFSESVNSSSFTDPALYKTAPVDTTINNVHCYYVDINLATIGMSPGVEQKIYLYKDKNFNSFYKLWGATYKDPNFCILGIYFFDSNNIQGFAEEPESLRRLSKKERSICEGVIRQALR